jgi:putative chitinase
MANKTTLINKDRFFEQLKDVNLPKLRKISITQVIGITRILDEWDNRKDFTDKRWLAYMLATVYHECDGKMVPIKEYSLGKNRPYGIKQKHSGLPYSLNHLYYGRGLVQLTWYENYELMGRLLGIDLLNNPELALDAIISVKILFEGMTKSASSFGDFTGRCLEMYFNDKVDDPITARKTINGLDSAKLITEIYQKFLKCLR